MASLQLFSGAAGGARQLRVGLALETVIVSRTNNPFQSGAYLGLQRAVRNLGVQGKVVVPAPNGTWLPSLSYLARQRYATDLSVAPR